MFNKYFPSWYVYIYNLSSSTIENKLSYYRSLIQGSIFQSPSYFTPNPLPPFSDATPWISSILNSQPFRLFTTDNSSLPQNTHSSIPFHQPLLQSFVQHTVPYDLQVDLSIINPHHSISEPQPISSNTCFNGWFGIPFQDKHYITHIRVPHPSEMLTLYNLHHFILFYHFILSESSIRQLVLHFLPSCLAQELIYILPLSNLDQAAASSQHKYTSHCFHLQLMPSSLTWKYAYVTDKDTSIIMHYLLYHQSFEKGTLSLLWAQFRSAIEEIISFTVYIYNVRIWRR